MVWFGFVLTFDNERLESLNNLRKFKYGPKEVILKITKLKNSLKEEKKLTLLKI